MTRLAIEGTSDADIEAWAISWLKARGYYVAKLDTWETPKEMCLRLKVSSSHLSSTLRDRRCPKPLDAVKGGTGRVNYLVSHPALDAFIVKHFHSHE
jgi:hypothetical protein